MNKKKEIKNLKLEIDRLKDSIWELKNPFKFNICDKIILENDTVQYIIVERYYEHYCVGFFIQHEKMYKMINYDNCRLYTQKENSLELYKKEKIKNK